ncbi:MAG: hypothetical protein AAFR17_17930 [Pseudomonadota bacterium]
MKLTTFIAALTATTLGAAALSAPAQAQDYNNWSTISPYGLEMVDPYGNVYYVDPYAYDSQVDAYGNVTSSYGYDMSPGVGMYDLTPNTDPYYDANPYAGATTTHDKFLEMIWE